SEFTINGHALWPLPTRDSFLPILSALHLAATRKRPLSEIVAEYAMSFAMSDRLQDFPVETSAALMTHLCESDDNLAAFLAPIGKVTRKSDIDGLRVTLSDARIIHFRPSGNAPEMRCYVEADSEQSAAELLRRGLARIAAWAKQQ